MLVDLFPQEQFSFLVMGHSASSLSIGQEIRVALVVGEYRFFFVVIIRENDNNNDKNGGSRAKVITRRNTHTISFNLLCALPTL